ncbi:hypothetical protein Bca4012_053104 [Brassica carinata]
MKSRRLPGSPDDFLEVQTTYSKSRRLPGSPDDFLEVQTTLSEDFQEVQTTSRRLTGPTKSSSYSKASTLAARPSSRVGAEGLGVKNIVPAYRSSDLQPNDILTGVSFASGGSGLDPMTAQVQGVIWIPDQLNDFKAYIAKLNSITGDEEKTRSIISNAVYVISAGNNDLGITFVSNPARNSRYTVFSYTNMMISWTQSFMQELYNLGARKFGIMGTLPLGCLPGASNAIGGICLEPANAVARLFNQKLANEVNNLNSVLPGSRSIYIDMPGPDQPTKIRIYVVNLALLLFSCGSGTVLGCISTCVLGHCSSN